MTQEEKARAYDKAIERAKAMIKVAANQDEARGFANTIFPELAESEDKKIMKEIAEFIYNTAFKPKDIKKKEKWLAWLEKQGEQKPILDFKAKDWYVSKVDGKIHNIYHSVDKIEPIFNVGDKIQYSKGCGTIMTIEKIENGEYIFANNMGHTTIENGNKCYLVERKPAEWHREDEQNLNACLGYIPDEFLRRWLKDVVHTKYDKPAWSEGDESILESVIKDVMASHSNRTVEGFLCKLNWVKSIKGRVQPKQEWSEEDERNSSYICAALDCYYRLREERNNTNGQECLDKARNWLHNKIKSLRPQNRWKPSDEQMMALLYHCSNGSVLSSLYNDLNKLKEGNDRT